MLARGRGLRKLVHNLVQPKAHLQGPCTGVANFSTTTSMPHYMDEVHKVRKLDKKLLELKEEELVQTRMRGWGSGGQKTNKTENCISLTHAPTGLFVKVHASRSVEDNMAIAKARLRMKLDVHVRGDNSVIVQEEKKKAWKKQMQKKGSEKLLKQKAKFREDIKNMDDLEY